MIARFRSLSTVLICAAAVCLASCSTLTLTDLGGLQRGMTEHEANTLTPTSPEHVWILAIDEIDAPVTIHHYIVTSGSAGSDYFLAFVDDALFFWGFPHEFAKPIDGRINAIGRNALAELDDEKRRQKERMGGLR